MKRKVMILFILVSMALAAPASGAQTLTLMLDWFPNVDHLPIYLAKASGYFADQGVDLEIIVPSETSDALKLAAAGKIDLAVSYQPQTIIAKDQGLDIRAVAPLVIQPLTTLLFVDKNIKKPSDLSGKKIGFTVPGLMDVLLKGFADINGINAYTPVNVGFTILPALASGQVSAVMGPFKTYETVTMGQHGVEARFFELEKYGIPDYEELIFVAGPVALETKKAAIHGFVAAIHKALADVWNNPDKALATYLDALPEVDRDTETKAFSLTAACFARSGQGHNLEKWQAFADFALKYGLISHPVDADTLIYTWK